MGGASNENRTKIVQINIAGDFLFANATRILQSKEPIFSESYGTLLLLSAILKNIKRQVVRCVIKEIWYKNNLTYTLKITALVNYMYLTECAVRASSQRAKLWD